MAVTRAYSTLRGSGRRASAIGAAALLLALGAPMSTVHAEESAPAPTTEVTPSEPAPAAPEVTVPEEAPATTEAAPSDPAPAAPEVTVPEEAPAATEAAPPEETATTGETLTPSGDPVTDSEMPSMGAGGMGDILPEIPGIIEAVPSPALPPETAAQNGEPTPTNEGNDAGDGAAATPPAGDAAPPAPEAAPAPPVADLSEPIVVAADQGLNAGNAPASDASDASANPGGLLGQALDMAQNSGEGSTSASRGGAMAENSAQAEAPASAGDATAAPGDDADPKGRPGGVSRLTSALGRGESLLGPLGSVGLGASAPDESRAIAANKQGFQHNSAAQSGTRGEITTNSTEAALRGVGLAAAAAIIGLGLNALSRRH